MRWQAAGATQWHTDTRAKTWPKRPMNVPIWPAVWREYPLYGHFPGAILHEMQFIILYVSGFSAMSPIQNVVARKFSLVGVTSSRCFIMIIIIVIIYNIY